MPASSNPPLVITMGDPAGIGPEMTAHVWTRRHDLALAPFCFLADVDHIEHVATTLHIDCPITRIQSPEDANDVFEETLPIIHTPLTENVEWGAPNSNNAEAILRSISDAVAYVQKSHARGIVTNPIHKASLQNAGFHFPGHTEFLGHLTQSPTSVMMLAIEGLRVAPVTVHMALRDVPRALTTAAISQAGEVVSRSLQTDFGIQKPILAVAGLNPHAGEDGKFGDEEDRIIRPAIKDLQHKGVEVIGPISADAVFAADIRNQYDAVLCMYHDQALIPLKALDFYGGVNITLGLPIVRTSPDHGTGFDLAGTGKARPDSLIAAIQTADFIATQRATA